MEFKKVNEEGGGHDKGYQKNIERGGSNRRQEKLLQKANKKKE